MRNADQSDAPAINQLLPEPLPAEPFTIFRSWFDQAHRERVQPNPNVMALATVAPDGTPDVRMVLCKQMNLDLGFLVFFTNYNGRKGRELAASPRAAVCFHWDLLDRQARFEGVITQSPAAESDAYYASRPLVSRASAWASEQSAPVASRDALVAKLADVERRFNIDLDRDGDVRGDASPAARIPRPPHWGGFRLWITRAELWVGGVGRLHDRAAWTRALQPATFDGMPGYTIRTQWESTRLQP